MKKLAVLAVVFAGLAAFVYFYEIEGQEARDEAKKLEESLLRIKQDQISQVEIVRKDKDPIRLVKKDEAWMLESPIQTSADKTTSRRMISVTTAWWTPPCRSTSRPATRRRPC